MSRQWDFLIVVATLLALSGCAKVKVVNTSKYTPPTKPRVYYAIPSNSSPGQAIGGGGGIQTSTTIQVSASVGEAVQGTVQRSTNNSVIVVGGVQSSVVTQ